MAAGLYLTKFVDEPNTHLRCPLCQEVYTNPVIVVSCGHTFCRECVISNPVGRCPVDGVEIETTTLVINRIVQSQVEDLLIYCCHGLTQHNDVYLVDPSGCKEKITLGKRADHENVCEFGTSACVNNPEHCGRFRRRDLEQHLQTCLYTACHNHEKGCEFSGTKEQVLDHLKVCGYRGLQRTSGHLDQALIETQHYIETNRELKHEVTVLTDRVGIVEAENRSLKTEVNRCFSQLHSLQKKCECLQGTIDHIQRNANRQSGRGSVPEEKHRTPTRSQRSPSTSSLNSPSQLKVEKWAMPFTFKCIGTYRGHKDVVFCTATCKQKLYSSGADGDIKIWDLDRLIQGCVQTLKGHTKTVHALIIGHGCLYSAGEDFSIKMWRLDTAEEYKSISNAHENSVCAMAISNEYLFTSSHSLIKVWDAKTLSHVHNISGLHHWVRAMVLSHTKDILYSGSHNTIDMWNATGRFVSDGKIEHTYGSIYSLAITQQYLIAGTYNRNIQVFDLVSRQHVNSMRGHIGTVTSIQAAQSGLYLFSSSTDKTIKVFEVKSHTHLRSLAGHVSTVSALLTSPSGSYLFSASHDQSVQVWSLENMLPIQSLKRHEGSVNCLSLQGDFLISGSEDTEIKIYKYFQMQIGI